MRWGRSSFDSEKNYFYNWCLVLTLPSPNMLNNGHMWCLPNWPNPPTTRITKLWTHDIVSKIGRIPNICPLNYGSNKKKSSCHLYKAKIICQFPWSSRIKISWSFSWSFLCKWKFLKVHREIFSLGGAHPSRVYAWVYDLYGVHRTVYKSSYSRIQRVPVLSFLVGR